MNVDFPDSPVPGQTNRKKDTRLVCVQETPTTKLTQEKQLKFPPGISLVFPELSFNLLIDPLLFFGLFAQTTGHHWSKIGKKWSGVKGCSRDAVLDSFDFRARLMIRHREKEWWTEKMQLKEELMTGLAGKGPLSTNQLVCRRRSCSQVSKTKKDRRSR